MLIEENELMLQNDWKDVLEVEFTKPYFLKLREFLIEEYNTQTIYPAKEDLFSALNLTPFKETKAVILGQDPYHGPGQAHGLSFSVKPGIKIPPSLRNIYKELKSDLGHDVPEHGYLKTWAKEGVLMLNTVLTVRKGEPNSHKGKGWEAFTDKIISLLNDRQKPIVFILWGKKAQAKEALITSSQHYIITSPHPSPFSANRGFFGSEPFSRTNEILENEGIEEIDWKIPLQRTDVRV